MRCTSYDFLKIRVIITQIDFAFEHFMNPKDLISQRRLKKYITNYICYTFAEYAQCATGNMVPVPIYPVTFFRSGSGPVPAKY